MYQNSEVRLNCSCYNRRDTENDCRKGDFIMDLNKIKEQRVQIIMQFACPSIIAMILTAFINIVDGFFIGNYVGTAGLAAVNLGLPIVYLYLAVGLMIAVGGISLAGRQLGAGNTDIANQVFRQTVFLCIIISFLLTAVMCFVLQPVAGLFTKDVLTLGYFEEYYGILIFELPLMIMVSALGMFIRGEGRPVFVMLTSIAAVLLNTLFDYIFAVPLSLGVSGIAWASFLAELIVLGISILYLVLRPQAFRFGKFHFEKNVIREIFFNGSSECIGELSMCISMAAYNYQILRHAGVDGLAAFTIIGYVSYVFSMIIVGFGQGIVPLISFSFGAQERKLAANVRNTTMKLVTGAAVLIFLIMTLISGWYCRIFSDSITVVQMVIPGLRMQMSSFAFAGINTIASFYFTAIGKAKESAVISASRGLVVLLAAIMILPVLFGINGVWCVSLTTEAATLLLSMVYMKRESVRPLEADAYDIS